MTRLREIEVAPVGEVLRRLGDLRRRVYRDLPAWPEPPRFLERERFDPASSFWKRHQRRTVFVMDGETPLASVTLFWPREGVEGRPRQGRFGVFECVPDPEVAARLLARADLVLGEAGCETVMGPFFFSMHEEVGLLVEGFESPPAIMMPFQPPGYAAFLEAAGYRVARRFRTFRYGLARSLAATTSVEPDGDGIRVRAFDRGRRDQEAAMLLSVYNAAFAGNWGFTPLSERGARAMVDEFLLVGDPELVRVAELEGRPVGFLLCLPDINEHFLRVRGWPDWTKQLSLAWALLRRRVKGCRVVTLAVHPEAQGRGISKRLISSLARAGAAGGYGDAELSYVDEGNAPMAGLMAGYEFHTEKAYRLYQKDFAGSPGGGGGLVE